MKKSIIETMHQTAKGLYDLGLVDVVTMHEFDSLCLPAVEDMSPNRIKKMRQREKVSQPVLAKFLNVSPSTVKKWERGEKHPSGAALRLLNVVDKIGLGIIAHRPEELDSFNTKTQQDLLQRLCQKR